MDEKDKDIVRRNRVYLLDIDYREIRDYLIQDGVVTSDRDEFICNGTTSKDKMRLFLDKFPFLGRNGLDSFINALDQCEADYSHVVERLDRDNQEQPCDQRANQSSNRQRQRRQTKSSSNIPEDTDPRRSSFPPQQYAAVIPAYIPVIAHSFNPVMIQPGHPHYTTPVMSYPQQSHIHQHFMQNVASGYSTNSNPNLHWNPHAHLDSTDQTIPPSHQPMQPTSGRETQVQSSPTLQSTPSNQTSGHQSNPSGRMTQVDNLRMAGSPYSSMQSYNPQSIPSENIQVDNVHGFPRSQPSSMQSSVGQPSLPTPTNMQVNQVQGMQLQSDDGSVLQPQAFTPNQIRGLNQQSPEQTVVRKQESDGDVWQIGNGGRDIGPGEETLMNEDTPERLISTTVQGVQESTRTEMEQSQGGPVHSSETSVNELAGEMINLNLRESQSTSSLSTNMRASPSQSSIKSGISISSSQSSLKKNADTLLETLTEKQKKHVPTGELFAVIAGNVTEIDSVGAMLKTTQAKRDQLKNQCPHSITSQAIQLFSHWASYFGKDATLEKFIKALCKAKVDNYVQHVLDYLNEADLENSEKSDDD